MCILFFLSLVLLSFTLYQSFDYFLFKFLIAENYVYTQSLDAIYNQALGEGTHKNYHKNFDEVMMSIFTEKIRSIDNDRYTYLYTPEQYKRSQEYTAQEAATAKVEKLTKDTVYVYLPNISKETKNFMENNIDNLTGFPNIIIDLTTNHGGDLEELYRIENLFVDKGATLGFETTRIPLFTKEVKAKSEKVLRYKNMILLLSGETASAAEGLTMCLKENLNNVTTIGTKSFGKGIGQITLPLLSGYAIKATVLTVETPNYNSIHKVGILPDVEYSKSDIKDFALQYLQENTK